MGTVTLTNQSNPIGTKVVKIQAPNNTADANFTGASGTLYMLQIDNSANSAKSYFKLVDATSATVGTTAPDMVFMIPASSTRTLVFPQGIAFSSGFTAFCVTAGGTAGTTSPGSAVVVYAIVG
jgi:hypothetical protein